MKKFLLLLACFLIVFISACTSNKSDESIEKKEAKATVEDVIEDDSKEELSCNMIAQSEFYSIYSEGTNYVYNIYDSTGNVVLTETTDRPLEMSMMSENVVEITKGMGTGLTLHKYYDVENNSFSEDFCYVAAVSEKLIAYIDIPSGFEDRRLIVRNIFDESMVLKEFYLDFSKIDTPIIDASFSKDNSFLQITYYSGKAETVVSENLNLY